MCSDRSGHVPRFSAALPILGIALLCGVALAFAVPDPFDLAVYRFGGKAVSEGRTLYGAEDPATGRLFTYPPFAGVLFVPLAHVPVALATATWAAAGVAALGVTMHLLLRERGVYLSSGALAGLLLLAVATGPVRETLHFGQVNLLLMGAICTDLLLLRGRGSGVLIGIAAGIKLTPLVFVVLLIMVGRRTAAVRAGVTFGATVLAGFVVLPASAATYWTRAVWDSERVGGSEYIRNQSIFGVMTRILGGEPSTLGWLLVAVPVSTAVLVLAAKLWRGGARDAGVCMAAASMLLASPISWDHHWVWGVPALLLLLNRAHAGFAAAWAVFLFAGCRIWVRHGERVELQWTWWENIWGNAFVWAALLAAALIALRGRRPPEHAERRMPDRAGEGICCYQRGSSRSTLIRRPARSASLAEPSARSRPVADRCPEPSRTWECSRCCE